MAWDVPADVDRTLPLGVRVGVRDDSMDTLTRGKAPTGHIAGHEVWYLTDGPAAGIGFLRTGSLLVVHFGRCTMEVLVADRDRIPYSELVKMVSTARLADCTDSTTWIPPVG